MSSNTSSNRGIYAGVLLLLIAVAAFFLFRPAESARDKGTPAEYVAALEPVLRDAQSLSGKLGDDLLDAETIGAITNLETAWAAVRTGPGYDRQVHDDFIIVFGSYVTRLKSASLLSSKLNNEAVDLGAMTEGEKTELMFILQSLHGIETAGQLMSRRGLTVDALLSRTNLTFEVTNSLAGVRGYLANAQKIYSDLKATPSVGQ